MKWHCLALVISFLPQSALWAANQAAKPNVIVIVADDLGYADLGCQGCKDIPTPNVDSLAKNGTRFTNGYVSCPVCSPTRAGLMTGRYQQRFGHEFNPGPADTSPANFGLPLTETTLANRLKALGYATGMVGKWHLGYSAKYHPQQRGFDEYFGFLGGAHSYVDARADKANPILRGTQPHDEKDYLTNAFTREALAFIDRHSKESFFLYLTYNAIHNPLQAPQKYLDRFSSIGDPKRQKLAAMLSAMDDGVGEILSKLRQLGIEDNTLIVFVSDNGGPTPQTSSRNNPLRSFKGTVWEGGVRVPFLMQWKGHIPAGKTFDQPVIALDIVPTTVAAAGGSIPIVDKLDGVNLLPHLTGKSTEAPHANLFWRFGPQWAIRQGEWKLTKGTGADSVELHNLATDAGQTTDLAAKRPDMVKQLEATYLKWDAELARPIWQKGAAKKAKKKSPDKTSSRASPRDVASNIPAREHFVVDFERLAARTEPQFSKRV